MRRLWYPDLDLSHPFPTLADWCGALDDRDSPIPEDIRARATDCFAELDATKECQFLLHGDFHHFNVLRATRDDWLVIDPRGVLGDPAYYGRFGFVPEESVTPPYPLPEEWADAWQSLRREPATILEDGALSLPAAWMDPALWGP